LLPLFAIISGMASARCDVQLSVGKDAKFQRLTGWKSDIPKTNANFDSFKGSKRQKSLSSGERH
jgi:hypothetical protein